MIQAKKSYGNVDIGMKKTTTYKVYMVECSDKSIYTGIAKDIEKRLGQHSRGIGSKYVRTRLPIKLQWSSKRMDLSQALKTEYQIKQWSKKKKLEWIEEKRKGWI